MTESILTSTKKILGIDENYVAFDLDVITHINSVFSVLGDLGIGPPTGFFIEDSTATWDDILAGDPRLNIIKTYIYLRVRMLFDPPTTSFLIEALTKQYSELEWRISIYREERDYPDGELVDSSYT